jgi:hypothetical protein
VNPEELSRELRLGSGELLRNRRGVVGPSLAAIGPLGVATPYQAGIVERAFEPPLPGVDADEVGAAPEAYAALGMPDAVLDTGSRGLTIALAAGREDRVSERPRSPLALAPKVTFGVPEARAAVRDLLPGRG